MKLFKGLIIFTLVVGAFAIGVRYFGCSFIRDYTVDEDKKIRDIRERIAELEKVEIKDTVHLQRISDQYSQLGTVYLEKRLWDQAVGAFEKSVAHGKTTPGVLYSLGLAYANRGGDRNSSEDMERAEASYRKAVDSKKDFDEARNALAILLFFENDKREEALAMAREIVARNKNYYIGRFTLGRFYYETGRLREALSVYEDLHSDLEKLPPSQIIEEYKKDCSENIQRIMMELSKKKGG